MDVYEIIDILSVLILAVLYGLRCYYYTRTYYLNNFNVKLSFFTVCGMAMAMGIDHRLLLILPIFKDESMDKKTINKANLILVGIYICIGIILMVGFVWTN